MPKRTDLKRIMLIGSGPIVIGQACEFDYSGTQALKALKEEGYEVVLVNSNPATIMTDPDLADRTYIEPIEPETVARIIERERPCALLPTLGGQTGLNTAVAVAENGILEKYGVEPDQLIDVKAIMGDASDNIPGVRGIGEKGALALIAEYGTLDAVYKSLDFIRPALASKLKESREIAYLSRDLATICKDAPIELSEKDLRGRMIGYGCVDSADPGVESVETVRKRIEAGIEICRKRGATLVWARARDSALEFYEHRGFGVTGSGYVDLATGVPHHDVIRDLI